MPAAPTNTLSRQGQPPSPRFCPMAFQSQLRTETPGIRSPLANRPPAHRIQVLLPSVLPKPFQSQLETGIPKIRRPSQTPPPAKSTAPLDLAGWLSSPNLGLSCLEFVTTQRDRLPFARLRHPLIRDGSDGSYGILPHGWEFAVSEAAP
jgi:hypothetical protein